MGGLREFMRKRNGTPFERFEFWNRLADVWAYFGYVVILATMLLFALTELYEAPTPPTTGDAG